MTLTEKSKEYAMGKHRETNHLYDGKPYILHLTEVFHNAQMFYMPIYKLHDANLIEVLQSAAYCHDVIEDCRETYNDVAKNTNEQVADIVYALTNEKGRNRDERANDKYYHGIKNTPHATYIKLCDRLANVSYSKRMGSSMFDKYRKEHKNFKSKLYQEGFDVMWAELENLFKD